MASKNNHSVSPSPQSSKEAHLCRLGVERVRGRSRQAASVVHWRGGDIFIVEKLRTLGKEERRVSSSAPALPSLSQVSETVVTKAKSFITPPFFFASAFRSVFHVLQLALPQKGRGHSLCCDRAGALAKVRRRREGPDRDCVAKEGERARAREQCLSSRSCFIALLRRDGMDSLALQTPTRRRLPCRPPLLVHVLLRARSRPSTSLSGGESRVARAGGVARAEAPK